MSRKTSSTGTWLNGAAVANLTPDGNTPGSFDMTFRIYRGDGNAASFSIVWQTYYTKKYL